MLKGIFFDSKMLFVANDMSVNFIKTIMFRVGKTLKVTAIMEIHHIFTKNK